jgi:hypothetical protein
MSLGYMKWSHSQDSGTSGDLMSSLRDSVPARPMTRAEIANAKSSYDELKAGQRNARRFEQLHPEEAASLRENLTRRGVPGPAPKS